MASTSTSAVCPTTQLQPAHPQPAGRRGVAAPVTKQAWFYLGEIPPWLWLKQGLVLTPTGSIQSRLDSHSAGNNRSGKELSNPARVVCA